MKTLLFFLFLSLNAHANLEEKCHAPGTGPNPTIEKCLDGTIAVLAAMKSEEADTPEATKKVAELWLQKNEKTVDFETEPAKQLAERLKKHAGNTTLANPFRSQLWLLASGMHGKIADKLRANGGLEQGSLALQCIKTSLQLDKTH